MGWVQVEPERNYASAIGKTLTVLTNIILPRNYKEEPNYTVHTTWLKGVSGYHGGQVV